MVRINPYGSLLVDTAALTTSACERSRRLGVDGLDD
jgi:hypothetical protein